MTFGLLIDFDLLKATTLTNTKPEVVLAVVAPILRNGYDVIFFAMGAPISTKFGSLMQKNTPITAKWSKSKSEVEFQYGGRLFFKNGSSYISAVN